MYKYQYCSECNFIIDFGVKESVVCPKCNRKVRADLCEVVPLDKYSELFSQMSEYNQCLIELSSIKNNRQYKRNAKSEITKHYLDEESISFVRERELKARIQCLKREKDERKSRAIEIAREKGCRVENDSVFRDNSDACSFCGKHGKLTDHRINIVCGKLTSMIPTLTGISYKAATRRGIVITHLCHECLLNGVADKKIPYVKHLLDIGWKLGTELAGYEIMHAKDLWPEEIETEIERYQEKRRALLRGLMPATITDKICILILPFLIAGGIVAIYSFRNKEETSQQKSEERKHFFQDVMRNAKCNSIGYGGVYIGEKPCMWSTEKHKSLCAGYCGYSIYCDEYYFELWIVVKNQNVMCTLDSSGEIVMMDVWQASIQDAKELYKALNTEVISKKSNAVVQLVLPNETEGKLVGDVVVRIVKKSLEKDMLCTFVEAKKKLRERIEKYGAKDLGD